MLRRPTSCENTQFRPHFARRFLISVPPSRLPERTLPKLKKDAHSHQSPASLSSKEAWKGSLHARTSKHAPDHMSGFPSQVLPSKTHKGFVSFCNRLCWQPSHCHCICPARPEQRRGGGTVSCNKERASPTLLQAENTTLHILGFMVKLFTRKEGRAGDRGRRTNRGAFFVLLSQ